jgi:hypothetical protein
MRVRATLRKLTCEFSVRLSCILNSFDFVSLCRLSRSTGSTSIILTEVPITQDRFSPWNPPDLNLPSFSLVVEQSTTSFVFGFSRAVANAPRSIGGFQNHIYLATGVDLRPR